MKIQKCKWYMDADSPVMFMIDDFCNTWVDNNGNNRLCVGEDWGHWAETKKSMWDILTKNIFSNFPEVKTTLFTVVGKREPIIKGNKKICSESILHDKKFLEFLRKIDSNHMIEIAYHGITHGKVGKTIEEFKEEWETYESLDQALKNIQKGKKIFFKALGRYPSGGKYCGYGTNEFSDESIGKSGFTWWCRHWDAHLEETHLRKDLSYELEMFNGVIDIPSTIDGSYYSIRNLKKILSKKYIKSIYLKVKYNKTIEKLINERIVNKQIISIQEHSAKYRADNRIQYPNIVSDMSNLIRIFSYLRRFNVWYATGSEIADYYLSYSKSSINYIGDHCFIVNSEKCVEGKELTIKIDSNRSNSKCIVVKNEKSTFILNKKLDKYIGNIIISNNSKYKIIEQ